MYECVPVHVCVCMHECVCVPVQLLLTKALGCKIAKMRVRGKMRVKQFDFISVLNLGLLSIPVLLSMVSPRFEHLSLLFKPREYRNLLFRSRDRCQGYFVASPPAQSWMGFVLGCVSFCCICCCRCCRCHCCCSVL